MKPQSIFLITAIAAIIICAFEAAYIIDETEQVIVTQFGKVIGEPKKNPGLNFKIPFIQSPNYFPKNIQVWDGDPGQIPTLDKTYIWVDTFALWKIVDPIKFFQTVTDVYTSLERLDDIIDPAVRNFITTNQLLESVRKSNRVLSAIDIGEKNMDTDGHTTFKIETGREKITEGIMKQAQPKLDKFGIKLVDVKVKRINYVEQVRRSVYERMIAERKQMAEQFRSEGMGEASKILGEKELDLKRITSEAYRTAQTIKGDADAESTEIFAKAYGIAPDLYSFTKTLEIYGSSLNDSSLILSTDSEFFKYLKGYEGNP